eukprot:1222327-Pyramimonas_sp.AAC.1
MKRTAGPVKGPQPISQLDRRRVPKTRAVTVLQHIKRHGYLCSISVTVQCQCQCQCQWAEIGQWLFSKCQPECIVRYLGLNVLKEIAYYTAQVWLITADSASSEVPQGLVACNTTQSSSCRGLASTQTHAATVTGTRTMSAMRFGPSSKVFTCFKCIVGACVLSGEKRSAVRHAYLDASHVD